MICPARPVVSQHEAAAPGAFASHVRVRFAGHGCKQPLLYWRTLMHLSKSCSTHRLGALAHTFQMVCMVRKEVVAAHYITAGELCKLHQFDVD